MSSAAAILPEAEAQPHAVAVLGPALAPGGNPSHAYLFHGPPGSGKRAAARALAARLLVGDADGAKAQAIAARVEREAHPDLTWVRPTGAAEMLVGDIDMPVVAAATRTPLESRRRVFVIEGADMMNDQAANRLLKTLEEPPCFVHLILLAGRPADMLPTIVSRCQLVRFQALPPERIARGLAAESTDEQTALACARLALGDADVARWLAGTDGTAMRAAVQAVAEQIVGGDPLAQRPWLVLLEQARSAGERAAQLLSEAIAADLELLPVKERRRRDREGAEAARRVERRERTRTLEIALRLLELWMRDLLCLVQGAGDMLHAVDMAEQLHAQLAGLTAGGGGANALIGAGTGGELSDALPAVLMRAVALISETRLALAQNVSEELALEALCYRLASAIGPRLGTRS